MTIFEKVEKYANDLIVGNLITGELAVYAAKRYFNDKKNAIEKGWYLDRPAGEKAVNFIQKLKHTKGKWAGQPLLLEPWQMFIVFNLFAWKRADGSRRFHYAYVEVARKNGKTALAAGIALYMLFADAEPRAEIYSAATTRDQAKLCFNDAKEIVKKTALNKRLNVFQHSITHEQSGSTFKALSSDASTQDGGSPHCSIIDEYHAHKTNEMVDVIKSGMGARSQPLMFSITTAGFNKNYPCFKYRENAINILRGIVEDDSLFIMIFSLDKDDDWDDPMNWIKANPNLNVSISLDYLESQVNDAKNRPEAVRNVKTKNLNMWVDSERTWILDEKWQECVGDTDIEELKGCKCYGGLDLSNVSDITAFVLLFSINGKVQILPFFWIPEETMLKKVRDENISYDEWVQKGYVKVTPGNVTDYDYIKADILNLANIYDIHSTAYDRWNSSQTVIDLQKEDFEMSSFGQGFGSMSAPSKEFEKLVLTQNLEHFANPVLRWMMASTAVQTDPAGNIKPDKKQSSQKIDGIVATIMALGEKMTCEAKEDENPYESRGLRSF